MIKESTYRRHLARAKNTSNYFTFFRLHYKIMSRLDALFLQDLGNLLDSPKTKRKKFDGEVYRLCTSAFLENSAGEWTRREQEPRLASLKKAGFIKTLKKGIPPRRWVRIEYKKIEDALDSVGTNSGIRSSPNGGDSSSPNGGSNNKQEKKQKERNFRPLSRNGKLTPSDQLVSVCRLYHEKLIAEKKIMKSTTPLKEWPKLAAKFIENLPDGESRFIRVVKSYVTDFGKPFMPEALSMRSLLKDQGDKFFRIEQKLNRPDWRRQQDPNKLRDDEQP